MNDLKPFDAVKKRNDLSTRSTSAIAKNAITSHSSNTGKKRVMGVNGVSQGKEGWKSQFTGAGNGYSKQINPIINSLSSAPTYDAPKIKSNLSTDDTYAQSLSLVGARNNAKLKSQNQRVLQGVLGSLVSGDSQNRATASRANSAYMNDQTKRRGQDFDATADANALAETSSRNKTLAKYYGDQTGIGQERNAIARESMVKDNETAKDPVAEKDRRLKIINDGSLQTLYGDNVWASMDDDQKSRAKSDYYSTGRIKDYEADNWLTRKLPFTDAEFRGGVEDVDGVTVPYRDGSTQQTQNQPQQETFKLDTNQTNTALAYFAKEENVPLSDVTVKDGLIHYKNHKVPLKRVWDDFNG